jgi:hypothetical protein
MYGILVCTSQGAHYVSDKKNFRFKLLRDDKLMYIVRIVRNTQMHPEQNAEV